MGTPWSFNGAGVSSNAGAATQNTPRVVLASDSVTALGGAEQTQRWAQGAVTPSNAILPVPAGASIDLSTFLAYAECTTGLRYLVQNCGAQPVQIGLSDNTASGPILAAGTAANDGKGAMYTGNLAKATAMVDQRLYFYSTVADANRNIRYVIEVF